MRYVYLIFIFVVVATVSILGFRGDLSTKPPLEVFPDMDRMPKYKPQSESEFFSDGRTDRQQVPNTVARGTFYENAYLQTGRQGTEFGNGIPIEVGQLSMARGEERYNIYCSVCHGVAGNGDSMTKKYGMLTVADLTSDIFVNYSDGQIYDVITNGAKTMMAYGDKLSVEDRWAVVLYVRALQKAANGSVEDLTPGMREELGL